MYAKIYHGKCLYIKSKHGISSSSFVLYKIDEKYIGMSMMWDLHFSLLANNGEKIKFKIYAIPNEVNYTVVHKRRLIKPLFKFKFDVNSSSDKGKISQKYDNYFVEFSIRRTPSGELYLCNPHIKIRMDFLDELLLK